MIKMNMYFDKIFQTKLEDIIKAKFNQIQMCKSGTDTRYMQDLGWHCPRYWVEDKSFEQCLKIAKEIRENADVLIIIGVGGSNQGARSVIKALQAENDKVEIKYAGNNLSGRYLNGLLRNIEGKSVYVNVIAKNFATLEPGIHFRVIRQWMEQRYSKEECAKRIVATGSLNGGSLEKLAACKGYRMIPFPLNVGGRFSVLTPVGVLPMLAAGLNVKQMIIGAQDLQDLFNKAKQSDNEIVKYAVARHMMEEDGYTVEILSSFDERLRYFKKWWVQLFSESEGKKKRGLFPASCDFTEDLHSMGQYIQQGKRTLIETFIKVESKAEDIVIEKENSCIDGFDYLELRKFSDLNNAAYNGTISAHKQGNVPCLEIIIPKLNEYYFGQLFYFFMMSCYISCILKEINPFDQPGVESYKEKMFEILGRDS